MTITPRRAAILLILWIGFSYWHFRADLAADPVSLIMPAVGALWLLFIVPGAAIAEITLWAAGIAPESVPWVFMTLTVGGSLAVWGYGGWKLWHERGEQVRIRPVVTIRRPEPPR